MTMTADGTAQTLQPGDAREVLREMAAVVRTVFGAGLQAARQATPPAAAEATPRQQVVVPTPEAPAAQATPVAPAPAAPAAAGPTAPASIPMPSIPLPDLPSEAVSPVDETVAEPATDPVVAPAATAPTTATETTDAVLEVDEPAGTDGAPASYTGQVPTLRLVPPPLEATAPAAPVPTVSAEHRQSVLREVAFLDDL